MDQFPNVCSCWIALSQFWKCSPLSQPTAYQPPVLLGRTINRHNCQQFVAMAEIRSEAHRQESGVSRRPCPILLSLYYNRIRIFQRQISSVGLDPAFLGFLSLTDDLYVLQVDELLICSCCRSPDESVC